MVTMRSPCSRSRPNFGPVPVKEKMASVSGTACLVAKAKETGGLSWPWETVASTLSTATGYFSWLATRRDREQPP